MELESPSIRRTEVRGSEGLLIVDCDVHSWAGDNLLPFLSERWRTYRKLIAARGTGGLGGVASGSRPYAARLDAFPPNGGAPGSDPEFAREQLLDAYGISAAIINNIECMYGSNSPVGLEVDMARATNDYNYEWWLESDPRWLASINVAPDHPEQAISEIVRCREKSNRYVQILLNSTAERPQGNPKYWPIYEAAAHYNLPVAFHVAGTKYRSFTGAGQPTFYYELRTSAPISAQAMVASLVFEGVFDRWPTLKIVHTELGWSWVVPLAWRLDSSWRVMREEVAHLQRQPSEYLREHFWFTTQPGVETEKPAQLNELYEQVERAGLYDRLLFASDYPHWDMDAPFDATPKRLSRQVKQKIVAGNAAALYGLEIERDA